MEKKELVTITRHFTVDMEKYAARRKTEASIPDDAEGADESDELDEAEAIQIVKKLLGGRSWAEYNETVMSNGLRKLPIENGVLARFSQKTGVGRYPAVKIQMPCPKMRWIKRVSVLVPLLR